MNLSFNHAVQRDHTFSREIICAHVALVNTSHMFASVRRITDISTVAVRKRLLGTAWGTVFSTCDVAYEIYHEPHFQLILQRPHTPIQKSADSNIAAHE